MRVSRLLYLFALVAIMFSGCSKDDDDSASFSILGRWSVDKHTTTINLYGESQVFEDLLDGWIEFKSNGAGIDSEGETFTWELERNTLSVTYDIEEFDPDFEFDEDYEGEFDFDFFDFFGFKSLMDFQLTTKSNSKLVGESNFSPLPGMSFKSVIQLSR